MESEEGPFMPVREKVVLLMLVYAWLILISKATSTFLIHLVSKSVHEALHTAPEGLFLMCWGLCREQTRGRGATSPIKPQDGCSQVKLDPCRKDSERSRRMYKSIGTYNARAGESAW